MPVEFTGTRALSRVFKLEGVSQIVYAHRPLKTKLIFHKPYIQHISSQNYYRNIFSLGAFSLLFKRKLVTCFN